MINIFFHCLTFPYPDLFLYLFPPCLCSSFIYLLTLFPLICVTWLFPVSPYLCYLTFPCFPLFVLPVFSLLLCYFPLYVVYLYVYLKITLPWYLFSPFHCPCYICFCNPNFLYLCYLSFLCYWVIWCIKNYLVITYISFKIYFAKLLHLKQNMIMVAFRVYSGKTLYPFFLFLSSTYSQF